MSRFSWDNEWRLENLKEESFLTKHIMDKTPGWVSFIREKVPSSLQRTLESAFGKAFHMVFQKGTAIIEKTYRKDEQKSIYKQSDKKMNREGFSVSGVKRFDRQAKMTIRKNLIISLFEGIALGLCGMGIPDIPIFVSVMLKSIYEIAISFGFGYTSEKEKLFILKLIDASLKSGDVLRKKNEEINELIDAMSNGEELDEGLLRVMVVRQTDGAANALSRELLYGKFIQGKAIIGLIGGVNDIVCLKRITDYAVLKYKRRFLIEHRVD
ncbi:MAG: EcsC family protein [Lachnospiraceae bacterium]|nr:EcsC family protein [Lachnospiraceae bacterium]